MALLKNVPFAVAGAEFMIRSEEDPGYIRSLAKAVDEKISVYLRMGSKVSLSMSAILTAMEYCDEYTKGKADVENMRSQIKTYIEEAQKYAEENEKLKNELAKADASERVQALEDENYQLRQQIGKLVEQISKDETYLAPSAESALQSENRRLCEELEKANAFIEEASRFLNERDELKAQLVTSLEELEKTKAELAALEQEIIENY